MIVKSYQCQIDIKIIANYLIIIILQRLLNSYLFFFFISLLNINIITCVLINHIKTENMEFDSALSDIQVPSTKKETWCS